MGNSLVLSCGRGSERELEGTDRLRQRGKQQKKRKKEVAESKTGEEE